MLSILEAKLSMLVSDFMCLGYWMIETIEVFLMVALRINGEHDALNKTDLNQQTSNSLSESVWSERQKNQVASQSFLSKEMFKNAFFMSAAALC